MLSRTLFVMPLLSVLMVAACSAKTNHPAAAETSSGNVAGGGHGSSGSAGVGGTVGDGGRLGDGGSCTTLLLASAPIVSQQQVAEAVPVPIGGIITDGTYFLTKDTMYTGPGGSTNVTGVTLQEIQAFAGTSVQVHSKPPSPTAEVEASGTFATSTVTNDAGTAGGFLVTYTFTCPSAGVTARNYSVVNGTTILEFVGPNEVLTYTLQ